MNIYPNNEPSLVSATPHDMAIYAITLVLVGFFAGWVFHSSLDVDVDSLNKALAVCETANSTPKTFDDFTIECHNKASFQFTRR